MTYLVGEKSQGISCITIQRQ